MLIFVGTYSVNVYRSCENFCIYIYSKITYICLLCVVISLACLYIFLCSASVLDRLNAVLEPGGVLTLDEKGADGDGIPSIKPHPSFR